MRLRSLLRRLPVVSLLHTAHPHGHFYSPVVDPSALRAEMEHLWTSAMPDCPGLDFNPVGTEVLLREDFARFMPEFDYPQQPPRGRPDQFFVQNSQFSWLDCRLLFVMLRKLRPAKMVEIGSGFSSLLSADVNQRFFGGAMDFTCVEPYPRPFLQMGVPGIRTLDVRKVQQIEPAWFDRLQAGDVLFIDSSHVAKTGSDVHHLYLHVLPRLRAGVIVHVHDIFLPLEYPRDWVIEENRSWNEQYLLQAMLQHSSRYQVLFGSSYAFARFPELVSQALGRTDGGFGGCSIWLRVCS